MSNLFYKIKPIIGLDFSKTGIRLVAVDRSKMTVHGYGSISLDPSKIGDDISKSSEYLKDKLNHLLSHNIIGKLNSDRAVLGLPTANTFARTFTLPVNKESKLAESANLEAEQYIPMPVETLYLDYQIIGRTKEELTVLMCAIPKSHTDTALEIVESAGIDVAMIEPSVSAVSRLLEYTNEGGMSTVIVDIGPVSTDIAVVDQAIRLTGGVNIGGDTLTLGVAKKMDIPIETAHQLKVLNGLSPGPRQAKLTAALEPNLSKIISETKKVIRFYTDRSPDETKLEQLLVVGSGSNIPGLGEFFTNELMMPARVASPWQALDFGELEQPSKQLRPQLASAAGLALVNPREIWK